MNITKNRLAKIFNRFSCRCMKHAVSELNKTGDFNYDSIMMKIELASIFARLANRSGHRVVSVRDINNAENLCTLRKAKNLLKYIERNDVLEQIIGLHNSINSLILKVSEEDPDESVTAAVASFNQSMNDCLNVLSEFETSLEMAGIASDQRLAGGVKQLIRDAQTGDGVFSDYGARNRVIYDVGSWLRLELLHKEAALFDYKYV